MQLVEHIDRLHVVIGHVVRIGDVREFGLVGHAREHQQRLAAATIAKLNVRCHAIADLENGREQAAQTRDESIDGRTMQVREASRLYVARMVLSRSCDGLPITASGGLGHQAQS